MTLPAFLFGFLISTLLGAGFHLIKGGSLNRLVLYIVLSWIGFWGGHFLAQELGITLWSVGPLRFGLAMVGCLGVLLIGQWLSQVRVEQKS